MWHETVLKELVLGRMLCLDASNSGVQHPILSKCHEMAGTQEWHHKTNVICSFDYVSLIICIIYN